MSTLAFNKEGEPFSFDSRTHQLRLRRFRKPGARGTCEAVLDADGEQVFVDVDADYAELRRAVDNVPGFYRLDQCDEDGRPIPNLPAAYVSLEAVRNTGPSSDADAMAVVRELAAINADVSKTMADRFASVMQSTAEILRAADGAGIAHRKPPIVSATVAEDDDEDAEDDEPDVPPANPMFSALANISTIVQAVQPLVEQLKTIYADMKANAAHAAHATSPAAATAPASEPAAAPAAEAASSGSGHRGGTAGVSGATAVRATEPVGATSATEGPTGSSAPANEVSPQSNPTASDAATAAPATVDSASTASSRSMIENAGGATSTTRPRKPSPSSAARPSDPVRPIAMPEHATALAVTTPTGPTVRNAPHAPTTQQLGHLMAIYARLTPKEQAIAEQVIARMSPEMRARWLVDLSSRPVSDAVQTIRDTIANLEQRTALRDRERR